MKIALIGYGKMGKTIEKIAIERGHHIVSVIDVNNQNDFDSEAFRSADVAIEFTSPQTAVTNYYKCFEQGVKVVTGTTGWLDRIGEIKKSCTEGQNTFFFASNFSIGVNIFFAVNSYLAKLMNRFTDYKVSMSETHHIHKLDAPSGTAITLAEGIISEIDSKSDWALTDGDVKPSDVAIEAIRRDEVPGIHEVCYESAVDTIVIKHDAKSREGFALGAVVAAEFVAERKGFLSMEDFFSFLK